MFRTTSRALALLVLLTACSTSDDRIPSPDAERTADADRLAWWRDARFGLFVHWGLYALLEGEWDGGTDYGEWIRTSAKIPRDEYAELVSRFAIPRFDAGRWADLAQAAGMRYVVITTKHHDGFCLWPSDRTGFDIASTPAGRDVMREVADAFRARGMQVCWYHSIMDWNHPDYLPRRGWESDRPTAGADFDRYVDYLHGQVTELLTRYGPIGVMWFDGEWESTWEHRHGQALYDLCRRLQPDVIVNNRVDKGRGGMAGMTTGAGFVGDFGTPEQEIPATGLPGVDWETCMTMNRHWGWNRADTAWKSSRDLIRKLCDIASKGGNFLLNVGPRPDGTFPDLAVERLEAIAAWMRVHAEAIHGTTASPVDAPAWGRVTARAHDGGTTLYLHVFDWPTDGRLTLPQLGNEVRGARLMAGDMALTAIRTDGGVVVDGLPLRAPHPDCSVVRVELDGAPIVYRAPRIVAVADEFVDATTVTVEPGSADLEVGVSFDGSEPRAPTAGARGPHRLTATTTLRARSFHDGRPVGPIAERTLRAVAPWPAAEPDPATLAPGLWQEGFAGTFDVVPDFAALTPEAGAGPVAAIGLPPGPAREHVALRLTGWLRVPSTGLVEFALASDDGSRLWIDDALVVDNDGLHGTEERRGTAPLAAGLHAITVAWFNKTGGAELALRLGPAGGELAAVPAARLVHRAR